MDAIDEKLLLALRENARASTARLARLVGRSRTSVQSRLERLERRGVIVGYGVRLAPEHDLGAVRAHVMIKGGPKETRSVNAAAQARVRPWVSGDAPRIPAGPRRRAPEWARLLTPSAPSMGSNGPRRPSFF